MGSRDKRVDAYIAKSSEFARPILRQLRDIVHEACPEVEETIKWGFPHFDYKGMLQHGGFQTALRVWLLEEQAGARGGQQIAAPWGNSDA